jgi:hypothetical protein
MHLLLTQGMVVEVIQAGVGQARIEGTQANQVERVVLRVVESRQIAHQDVVSPPWRMAVLISWSAGQARSMTASTLCSSLNVHEPLARDDSLPGVLEFLDLHVIGDLESDGDLIRSAS